MKARQRQISAAELIAFLNSDNVRFTGAQLNMVTKWVELCQWVAKEAVEELKNQKEES